MSKLKLSERLIEKSFFISVWTINQLYAKSELKEKVRQLEKLPEGTLGKEVANCLKENGLNLVPGYENHDLKHTLLNFKMTPLDEIRMQAFMLGNGNWSIPSLAIFFYGFALLPFKARTFWADFQKGRKALPVKNWTLEEFAHRSLTELQESVFHHIPKPSFWNEAFTIRNISQYGSLTAVVAGIFGMLFCFPFLWSSNMADLVGAGFPFVAGAILTVGGLMNLSILSKKEVPKLVS